MTAYRWSFIDCKLRSCHWAYESATLVHSLLSTLVDEANLPAVLDVRACLTVDVSGLVVSVEKVEALRGSFIAYADCFTDPAVFDEQFLQIRNFILVAVEEILNSSGLREEMTFHLSVCCPALLLSGEVEQLSEEVERFTGLLMDLGRIKAAEKKRMDRGFPLFLERYRRLVVDVSIEDAGSAVEIFRVCDSAPVRRLFRYLMCLNESPLLPMGASCLEVGQLSSDVTTSVCSSILSYLRSHSVRNFESVSGPILEEICESFGRFTVLSELSEDMLWDDVGVVAAEDYRASLYELMGFTMEGDRAASPEI